ncbi:hypothetical protein GCM10007159_37810 [Modicisalibacter luteus]|nr:hypothetical protein GCM10007159_37810 [Halomonas lutea]
MHYTMQSAHGHGAIHGRLYVIRANHIAAHRHGGTAQAPRLILNGFTEVNEYDIGTTGYQSLCRRGAQSGCRPRY